MMMGCGTCAAACTFIPVGCCSLLFTLLIGLLFVLLTASSANSISHFINLDIFGAKSEQQQQQQRQHHHIEYDGGAAELLPPVSSGSSTGRYGNNYRNGGGWRGTAGSGRARAGRPKPIEMAAAAAHQRFGANGGAQQQQEEEEDDNVGNELPAGVYDTNLENNMTRILNALIASHDRRIRPNFGGPPTIVNVTIHVITISAISEVSMDYTLDIYLRQFWHDSRLVFKTIQGHDNLTVGIDMVKSIWTPDTFFPNEKKSYFHETTSHNSFLRIDSKGNVIRSIRLTVTANCPMSLHTFPLDKQICPLEIESYGYSTSDIIYHWQQREPVTVDTDVNLAHFSITGFYQVERTISLSTGNYSRLTTYFTFKRNLGFYLIQIYFPSSLIVVISWVSFFLNREATQARVTIGVTTVLTQTTLMTSTNASLPKVSYVKSLDIFLGVCFFIVFASLLEYAAVGFLMKRQRHKGSGGGSSSSLLPRSSTATVCFYELEDGTVRMNQNATTTTAQQQQQQPNSTEASGGTGTMATVHPKRFKARKPSAVITSTNGGPEHGGGIPLLGLSSQPLSPAAGHFTTSPPHMQNRHSMSLCYLPDEAVTFALAAAAGGGAGLAGGGTGMHADGLLGGRKRAKKGCHVRPCQVDLFSRIAFPIFFLCFHLAYWLIYLNIES